MGFGGGRMSSMAGGTSRCMDLPAGHLLASEAWWSHAFVRPVVPIFAACLVATALAAGLKLAAPVTERPASVEPAGHIVNVANKGSRLETTAAVIATQTLEPPATSAYALASTSDTLVVDMRAAALDTPGTKGKPTIGLASYYWQGTKTASGERFNAHDLTAAHRTLPFGTRVRVTSLATGRSVTVRINDRGPFVDGRIVDISRGAAQSLGMIDRGVTKVKLDVLQ
jgi:rare lipoprotein A (peptidoglycan hydrolase)